jgi:hypothetical protein
MRRASLVAGIAVALLAPAAAHAHQGNPNMTSIVRSVTPSVPGVKVEVLGGGDQMQVTNRSGEEVLLYGYGDPPQRDVYARLLPSGVVQENRNSPAYYLNQDYFGDVPVPAHAKVGARPDWVTVANDGRLQWHDHRSHYMGHGTPPGIRDKGRRQKWADFTLPITVGGRTSVIHGTILWVPSSGGAPVVAFAVLAVVVLLALGAVVVVRRRRRGATDGAAPPADAGPGAEAW